MKRFLIICLFLISLSIPAPVFAQNGQDLVINSDDTILGRITSITPGSDAGEMSVMITSITRGMYAPQPAKVGDTLLQDDLIVLVPGAFAKVKFADRAESMLSGGTEGNGFVIRRGNVEPQLKEVTSAFPTTTAAIVGDTTELPLKKRTYTIPKESGQPTSVTIYDTGGKTDYIVRGGEKILVKRGMEIKSGDEIFIIGINSIELSDGKFLSPDTIWTIKGSEIELENVVDSVSDQGFFQSVFQTIIGWFKPFEGISEDIGRGAKTFLPNPDSQEN